MTERELKINYSSVKRATNNLLVIEYEDVLKRKQDSLTFSEARIDQFLDYLCMVCRWHEVFFPVAPDPE